MAGKSSASSDGGRTGGEAGRHQTRRLSTPSRGDAFRRIGAASEAVRQVFALMPSCPVSHITHVCRCSARSGRRRGCREGIDSLPDSPSASQIHSLMLFLQERRERTRVGEVDSRQGVRAAREGGCRKLKRERYRGPAGHTVVCTGTRPCPGLHFLIRCT